MLSLAKINKQYCWIIDSNYHIGNRSEMIAYGYWTFGIPKEEIAKALQILDNSNLNTIPFINCKISLTNH